MQFDLQYLQKICMPSKRIISEESLDKVEWTESQR